MRRITNLPSRQSERHQQREDPRNPLCQPLRIRFLHDLFDVFARTLPTNGSRGFRNPYPSICPARISTHKQDEAPERQVYGDDIDSGGGPGVYLAGVNGRQEQESQLTPGQNGRWSEQSCGEKQEGDEVAVAVRPRDDVTGQMFVEFGELGEGFHAGPCSQQELLAEFEKLGIRELIDLRNYPGSAWLCGKLVEQRKT